MLAVIAAKTPGHKLPMKPPAYPAEKYAQGTGSDAATVVVGPPIPITHGIVQVRITVAGGHITNVIATSLPHDNDVSWTRSEAAAAILDREVMAAQSAHVHAVSGATYTSKAYMASLQAAIDAAGIAKT